MAHRVPGAFVDPSVPTKVGRSPNSLIRHPWIRLVADVDDSGSAISQARVEVDRAA